MPIIALPGISIIAVVAMMLYFLTIRGYIKGWTKTPAAVPPIGNAPRISIVVAFRNEAANLPLLLNSFANQEYPHDLLEVILVDDGSSDNWQNAIAACPLKNIITIANTGQGKKAALRTGINLAGSNIILTTDADCQVPPGWARAMVGAMVHNRAALVIGPVALAQQRGFFQYFQRTDFLSLQLSGAGAAAMGRPIMCNGANMAFGRNFYLGVPHLNDRFLSGDDMFLLHAAKQQNRTIAYAFSDKAVVVTHPQASLRTFWLQRIRWASKAKGYSDAATLHTAVVVAAANFALTGLFVLGLIWWPLWLLYAILLSSKALVEYRLFALGAPLFGFRPRGWQYVAVHLLHPFYTTATVATSLFANVDWKGRRTIG